MAKINLKVKLVGEDGNAFAILGKVKKALQRAGFNNLASQYMKEAMDGDYDNLLRVTSEYVDIE